MLIALTIALIVALILGKISYKEIKEYVRKHREGSGKGNPGVSGCADRRNEGRGEGGKEEGIRKEGKQEGED